MTSIALDRFAVVVGDPSSPGRAISTGACPAYLAVIAHGPLRRAIEGGLGALPPSVLRHVGQRITVTRQVPMDDGLRAHARLSGTRAVPGGRLVAATAVVEGPDGPVATVESILLVRGPGAGRRWGEVVLPRIPPPRTTDGLVVHVMTRSDDPDRYAEVSGDRNPIHLDDAVARAAGLDGRILHGGFVLASAVAALRSARPRASLARAVEARFGAPARPGVQLRIDAEDDGTAIRFRVDDGSHPVIRAGLLRLADHPHREDPT